MEQRHDSRHLQASQPEVSAGSEQKIGMRIVVATEHRAYRDVISGALRVLRPLAEVIAVEPEDLDRVVAQFSPHLVVCSRLSYEVEATAPAWIELYPDSSSRVTVSLAGKRTTLAKMDIEGMLSIVNLAEGLREST